MTATSPSAPATPSAPAPGTTAPGTTAPGATAPGTTAPGTTAPGTTAPGATAPLTSATTAAGEPGGEGAAAPVQRAVPYHCPFCAEEDLRPVASGSAPGLTRGGWHCRSCLRVFSLSFHGVHTRQSLESDPS